jgi:hypothetical protein
MPDVTSAIHSVEQSEKRRAQKRADFLRLASDPDVADLVTKVAHAISKAAQNGHIPSVDEIRVPPKRMKPGTRTGLGEAIASIGEGAPDNFATRFTWHDVARVCKERGTVSSRRAIRDAIYRLVTTKPPVIRIVKKGTGGKPSLYEFVPQKKPVERGVLLT